MNNDYRTGLEFDYYDFKDYIRKNLEQFVAANNIECTLRWYMTRVQIEPLDSSNYWINTKGVAVVVVECQEKNHRLLVDLAWSDFVVQLPDNWRKRNLMLMRDA